MLCSLPAEEAEGHRATQEAGAVPCSPWTEHLCCEPASTVDVKSVPHQGHKSPKIGLGASSPSNSPASFQSLCMPPLQEGEEGLRRPL